MFVRFYVFILNLPFNFELSNKFKKTFLRYGKSLQLPQTTYRLASIHKSLFSVQRILKPPCEYL